MIKTDLFASFTFLKDIFKCGFSRRKNTSQINIQQNTMLDKSKLQSPKQTNTSIVALQEQDWLEDMQDWEDPTIVEPSEHSFPTLFSFSDISFIKEISIFEDVVTKEIPGISHVEDFMVFQQNNQQRTVLSRKNK